MRGLAADPNLAAFEMFLLPDGYDFLQAVDRESAGLEGFCAMWCRDCYRDRGFADFDDADAMCDRDARDFPSRARFDCELAHLGQRHRLVGFVLEAKHGAAGVVAASRAGERHDRAGGRVGDLALERGHVDGTAADCDFADAGGYRSAAADRWDECYLVALARFEVAFDIFLVDG